MKPISSNQINTRMLLCPRAPQGPVWYCITRTKDTHITQKNNKEFRSSVPEPRGRGQCILLELRVDHPQICQSGMLIESVSCSVVSDSL